MFYESNMLVAVSFYYYNVCVCLRDEIILVSPSLFCRYENPGDASAGYSPHARQCAAALLLCFLHLWDCRRPVVGWASPQPLLPP